MNDSKKLAVGAVKCLEELGVNDQEVLAEIEQHVEKILQDTETQVTLARVWPSPKTWLGALLGTILSDPQGLIELGVGVASGVAGSQIIEITWDRICLMFPEESSTTPKWKDGKEPNKQDRLCVESVITDLIVQSQIWKSKLSEKDRRTAAAYKYAAKNIHKPGPRGDLARMLF